MSWNRILQGNPARQRLNDEERELWVLNDEWLYQMQRRSRKSMRQFIRENREEIDAAIRQQTDKPPRQKQWYDY